MRRKTSESLRRAYVLMHERFGHLQWWPGDTPFEVCVGAILTQNTSWTNVERAILNLKTAGVLEPRKLFAMPAAELAQLIRPAGYFNLKTQRLRAFLKVLIEDYEASLPKLMAGPTAVVRERLLNIYGIGRETADSMLLYAGKHHSFVIDAYTKRIFTRHHWWRPEKARPANAPKGNSATEYESLKQVCEHSLNEKPETERLDYWQDYHAQLVMVGKFYCHNRIAHCDQCPLRSLLPKR